MSLQVNLGFEAIGWLSFRWRKLYVRIYTSFVWHVKSVKNTLFLFCFPYKSNTLFSWKQIWETNSLYNSQNTFSHFVFWQTWRVCFYEKHGIKGKIFCNHTKPHNGRNTKTRQESVIVIYVRWQAFQKWCVDCKIVYW